MHQKDVIFDYHHEWGIIRLQKPSTLNALNLNMVVQIKQFLESVEDTPFVQGILIESSVLGIFCAGGDIKDVYQWYQHHNDAMLLHYIQQVYNLNAYIRSFKKTVVALVDGITLGGGVGLSRYARYRIMTDRAVVGMPEIKIAFFPDVGAGYFLNLLDPSLARFLALTGYLLKGGDLLTTGYGTHLISYHDLDLLQQSLLNHSPDEVEKLLQKFSYSTPSILDTLSPVIECFQAKSLMECIQNLASCAHPEAENLYRLLLSVSPLSLHIIWRYMDISREKTYLAVQNIDLQLSQRMMNNSDLFEGIRTRLIDKHHQPVWRHRSIHDVSPEEINAYFN